MVVVDVNRFAQLDENPVFGLQKQCSAFREWIPVGGVRIAGRLRPVRFRRRTSKVGGRASYLWRPDALRKTKVKLRGNIVVAAIVGESEKRPSMSFKGWSIRVPVQCKLCIDVRLPPNMLPVEVSMGCAV